LNWAVPKVSLVKFDTIQEKVVRREQLRISPEKTTPGARGLGTETDLGYDCVDLSQLRFMSVGSVYVPGFGLLDMNAWSRSQLGTELGVRWDKFFGEMTTEQIQKAVTDHLRSRGESTIRKIIARRYDEGELRAPTNAAGILRGMVSPGYSEIRDVRLFDRMRQTLGSQIKNLRFTNVSFKPNASHFFLCFDEAFDALRSGKAPIDKGDMYYFGLRVRNSEVGAHSLSGAPWFMKFVCVNGAIVSVEDGPILNIRHRNVEDSVIDTAIDNMFRSLPEAKEQTIIQASKLSKINLLDPRAELRRFLHGRPKYIIESAEKAWEEEGCPTDAFGVMQSLARVAMAGREDRDHQIELEKLAGQWMTYRLRQE
jgi:hypothetical protein